MEKKYVWDGLRRAVLPILLLCCIALTQVSTFAAQAVTLAWNPSPDPSVTGYFVYYGVASRTYTNKTDVGSSTNITISGLVEGTTYYFAATAYNILGAESDYSTEVVYTVPVPAGNQTPTLNAIGNLTLTEDAAAQTVTLSGIGPGTGDSGQTLTVTASSSNTGLIPNPNVTYTSPNATGSLSFTPVPNANGSAIITVTVNDNQASNNIFSRTFTVTVNPANDTPTLNTLSNLTINEDAGTQTVNLTGISSGASNENQTLVVTTTSSNTGLIPTPTVTYTSPNSTGTLSFAPAASVSGTVTITVTVNDGQAANNTVTRSFTVTVAAVNDTPTLNPISDVTLNQGTASQVVNLSGISAGTGESQSLSVTASSSNTGLIPNPPVTYSSPSATGSLMLSPVAGMSGTATITVNVNDGQPSNNIVSRTFTVTVNSRPTISVIPNQLISTNSDTGPIPFVIGDRETPADNLILFAASSVPSLIPTNRIVFGGSASNRTVTLTPVLNQSGVANITITVSDGTSVSNRTFQLTVLGPPPPPSGITIVGEGAVSPNVSGQTMVVGQTYTLTATPSEGQVFVGWSGSYTSKNSKLTFTYRTNVNIQATFMASPYYPVAGKYNGLFYEDATVRLPTSGYFNVVVTRAGTYSGKLQVGIKKIAFTGKLTLDCLATNRLVVNGLPVILDFFPQSNQITGHITSGLWVSTVLADRVPFNSISNPAPYMGKYTMVVPGVSGDPLLPAGHGYGAVNVGGSGIVMFGGTLADGTKVTQSAYLSENGQWPFYIPLYKGKGSVLSWLAFADRVNDDINGTLNWIKLPSTASKYYRTGFDFDSQAVGSTYTVPGVGTNILDLTTAQMTFDGGNLGSGFVNSVSFGTNSHLINLSSNGLAVTFSPGKGTFIGKVLKPTGGKAVPFSGVVLQKLNAGYGFLLGTNQSSQVLLAP